jgi:hypothetical protein
MFVFGCLFDPQKIYSTFYFINKDEKAQQFDLFPILYFPMVDVTYC